jgi:hypothetical protein
VVLRAGAWGAWRPAFIFRACTRGGDWTRHRNERVWGNRKGRVESSTAAQAVGMGVKVRGGKDGSARRPISISVCAPVNRDDHSVTESWSTTPRTERILTRQARCQPGGGRERTHHHGWTMKRERSIGVAGRAVPAAAVGGG